MRYGVLADVHANLPALEAALGVLAAEGIERLLCAGDIVGYGPWPDACLSRLEEAGAAVVAGNHDLIVTGALPLTRTSPLARRTLEWTREEVGPATRDALAALPLELVEGGVVITHGALGDPEVYVADDSAALGQLGLLAERHPAAGVLVLGHTHRAHAVGERRGRLLSGRAGRVELDAGERMLLNPGSVGQARERRPVGRALVLDTDRGEALFRAFAYDHRGVRRALVARGLPPGASHRPPSVADRLRRVKRVVGRTGLRRTGRGR
jgi:predicted phosphodiesterase